MPKNNSKYQQYQQIIKRSVQWLIPAENRVREANEAEIMPNDKLKALQGIKKPVLRTIIRGHTKSQVRETKLAEWRCLECDCTIEVAGQQRNWDLEVNGVRYQLSFCNRDGLRLFKRKQFDAKKYLEERAQRSTPLPEELQAAADFILAEKKRENEHKEREALAKWRCLECDCRADEAEQKNLFLIVNGSTYQLSFCSNDAFLLQEQGKFDAKEYLKERVHKELPLPEELQVAINLILEEERRENEYKESEILAKWRCLACKCSAKDGEPIRNQYIEVNGVEYELPFCDVDGLAFQRLNKLDRKKYLIARAQKDPSLFQELQAVFDLTLKNEKQEKKRRTWRCLECNCPANKAGPIQNLLLKVNEATYKLSFCSRDSHKLLDQGNFDAKEYLKARAHKKPSLSRELQTAVNFILAEEAIMNGIDSKDDFHAEAEPEPINNLPPIDEAEGELFYCDPDEQCQEQIDENEFLEEDGQSQLPLSEELQSAADMISPEKIRENEHIDREALANWRCLECNRGVDEPEKIKNLPLIVNGVSYQLSFCSDDEFLFKVQGFDAEKYLKARADKEPRLPEDLQSVLRLIFENEKSKKKGKVGADWECLECGCYADVKKRRNQHLYRNGKVYTLFFCDRDGSNYEQLKILDRTNYLLARALKEPRLSEELQAVVDSILKKRKKRADWRCLECGGPYLKQSRNLYLEMNGTRYKLSFCSKDGAAFQKIDFDAKEYLLSLVRAGKPLPEDLKPVVDLIHEEKRQENERKERETLAKWRCLECNCTIEGAYPIQNFSLKVHDATYQLSFCNIHGGELLKRENFDVMEYLRVRAGRPIPLPEDLQPVIGLIFPENREKKRKVTEPVSTNGRCLECDCSAEEAGSLQNLPLVIDKTIHQLPFCYTHAVFFLNQGNKFNPAEYLKTRSLRGPTLPPIFQAVVRLILDHEMRQRAADKELISPVFSIPFPPYNVSEPLPYRPIWQPAIMAPPLVVPVTRSQFQTVPYYGVINEQVQSRQPVLGQPAAIPAAARVTADHFPYPPSGPLSSHSMSQPAPVAPSPVVFVAISQPQIVPYYGATSAQIQSPQPALAPAVPRIAANHVPYPLREILPYHSMWQQPVLPTPPTVAIAKAQPQAIHPRVIASERVQRESRLQPAARINLGFFDQLNEYRSSPEDGTDRTDFSPMMSLPANNYY